MAVNGSTNEIALTGRSDDNSGWLSGNNGGRDLWVGGYRAASWTLQIRVDRAACTCIPIPPPHRSAYTATRP
jgi:hypothetical protein